jgi:hypothetical protein
MYGAVSSHTSTGAPIKNKALQNKRAGEKPTPSERKTTNFLPRYLESTLTTSVWKYYITRAKDLQEKSRIAKRKNYRHRCPD